MKQSVAEHLRSCPKGIMLYSVQHGPVKFIEVSSNSRIKVDYCGFQVEFLESGKSYETGECLLWPSKDCRCWDSWTNPGKDKFRVGTGILVGGKKYIIMDISGDNYLAKSLETGESKVLFSEEGITPISFDYKHLSSFTKVLVRDHDNNSWELDLFGRIGDSGEFICMTTHWTQCIPWAGNEEFYGKTTEAPEYYRVAWE